MIQGAEAQGVKDLFDVFAVINKVYFKLNWSKNKSMVRVADDITKLDYLKKALKYAYRAGYKQNANITTDFSKSADCLLRANFTSLTENKNYMQHLSVRKLYKICIAMQSSHPDNEVAISKIWNCICSVIL